MSLRAPAPAPAPASVLDLPILGTIDNVVGQHRTFAFYAPFFAAAIAIAAGLVALNDLPVGGFYDDGFYVILAKSIATGHGYRNLNLPGAPFATHYPPGYPLLLAALWRIWPAFPANVILFKLANVAFLALIAAFGFRHGRERMGLGVAASFTATVLGTATTPALYLSSMVLSEPMFLALALLFLVWAERVVARDGPDTSGALSLGVCAGLLFLVRSQAIAMIAATVIAYAFRRRWRESMGALAAAGLVVLPWLIWVAAHDMAVPHLLRGDYGSYFAWFVDGIRERGVGLVFEATRRNVPDILAHVAHRLSAPGLAIPGIVASLCVGVLGIPGMFRLARRAPVTLVFLLAYLGLVAIWPFPPARFVLGVWILVMLVLACGAEVLFDGSAIADRWKDRRASQAVRAVGAVASLVLLAGAVAYNVRGYQRRWWASTEEQSARWILPKVMWVRANTDTSAVIATDHDEAAVYLYTGRRSVPVTTFTASEFFSPRDSSTDDAVLRELTTSLRAQYLTLSSPRLRGAAMELGASGEPLGDATHHVVPWAFKMAAR